MKKVGLNTLLHYNDNEIPRYALLCSFVTDFYTAKDHPLCNNFSINFIELQMNGFYAQL